MAKPVPGASEGALRLLVVGAGAKALFALEELAARLRAHPGHGTRPRLEITVIDPGEHPGTGAAYHPAQPRYLRLNVDSAILDAPPVGDVPAFSEWARDVPADLGQEPYPPRALVGDYLRRRWEGMCEALAPSVHLRHHRSRALAVRREGAQWRLEVEPVEGGARQLLGPAHEVLLATGHAGGHDGALGPSWTSALPLIPAVLPTDSRLSPAQVPPGARVALRGGALTFIDAALALTLGRGARFSPDPAGGPGLVHHRSPEEPAVLLPTTRHGLLLEAKPRPGTPLPVGAERTLADGARRLDEAGPLTPAQVRELLVETAAAMLAGGRAPGRALQEAVAGTLAHGAEPDLPRGPGRAEQALRRSVAVAEGSRAPGPAWALGRTWALLYPRFTVALHDSDVGPEDWARQLAAQQTLERFAFGPPLEMAQMLLAMLDSGALDLAWVDAGVALRADGVHGLPAGALGPDVVIDAVNAPPGLRGITDPLAVQLRGSGLVRLRPGRRGATVAADGTALTADGPRADGLALLGRATEDHVIGHDTLNRHLHGETARWAERVTRRASQATARPHDLEESA